MLIRSKISLLAATILCLAFVACKKGILNKSPVAITAASLLDWFESSGGAFSNTLVFNKGLTQIGNSKTITVDETVNHAKWNFSAGKLKNSKNFEWLEVPFEFLDGSNFLVENIAPGKSGLEADFTKGYLHIIIDKQSLDTSYLVRLISTRLPVETHRRKDANRISAVREVYYDSHGKIIADYDIIDGVRKRFSVSEPVQIEGRSITKKVLTCTQSSTKFPECKTMSGGETVCTFYTVTLTRCVNSGTSDPNDLSNNNEYLEESTNEASSEFIFETVELQNQQLVDSLQGFPCAQGVLAELPSCNSFITDLMRKIFSPETDELDTLRFKVDQSLTKDSLLSGYFVGDQQLNKYWYKGTIFLNPWELNNSTKEFIVSTMIHEVLHSIMGYDYSRYRQGVITKDSLIKKYPCFFDFNNSLSDDELAEHEEFAYNYRRHFVAVLKQFNARISNEMAEALAWTGLHKTTVWKSNPDTTRILNLIHIARQDKNPQDAAQYGLTKCF